MSKKKEVSLTSWQRRKARTRKKVRGTADRLRLNVFRSSKHIYAQVINDLDGTTVAAASTRSKDITSQSVEGSKVGVAKAVGLLVGKLAIDRGVESVVFDRSGYIYHGRVKAVAEGAREAGLKF